MIKVLDEGRVLNRDAVMKYWQKETGKERVYLALYFHIIVHHWRNSMQGLKQGRNLEEGADAEAMKGSCLLAQSTWFVKPAFL